MSSPIRENPTFLPLGYSRPKPGGSSRQQHSPSPFTRGVSPSLLNSGGCLTQPPRSPHQPVLNTQPRSSSTHRPRFARDSTTPTPVLQKKRDAYEAFDSSPDAHWSTIQDRKKQKTRPRAKTFEKTTGVFRLPLTLPTKENIHGGNDATQRRISYLPPAPKRNIKEIEAVEESDEMDCAPVHPVRLWKVTRVRPEEVELGLLQRKATDSPRRHSDSHASGTRVIVSPQQAVTTGAARQRASPRMDTRFYLSPSPVNSSPPPSLIRNLRPVNIALSPQSGERQMGKLASILSPVKDRQVATMYTLPSSPRSDSPAANPYDSNIRPSNNDTPVIDVVPFCSERLSERYARTRRNIIQV
ncbi:hypothetical protein PHLCEN_2v11980 [Hermanssonia centrifuga]|uniref:Uncharacterized protein n=1 Tax=Hermanssonia centrifuga TaxID=98765 RepID=A0A2R6NJF0_9APHY|nr:hypothetical protein PHLCEN_2v11980 [Hermanssonia centrifuga]